MYGMINQAIEELVRTQHGPAAWQQICADAGITDADFISLQSYPDDITYRLVGAASRVLNVPAADILEAFGESWTAYARNTAFSRLMQFAGRTFPDFVAGLDQMHAKLKFSLPDLEPPAFRVTDLAADSFRLHYYSKRDGLAPLVVGMMRGVGKIFDMAVDIRLDRARGDGHDHDEFVVAFAPTAAAKAAPAG